MKKSNQYVLKIVGCMLLVMVCALIVFTYQDFPARLMAAILGVVITATITVVLLDGQSKKEQMAKRDSKVFEEKLRIYQKFLETLYNAVKNGELTESEKLDLQYQTSLVAMLCSPENIQTLSEAVKKVISAVCGRDAKSSPNKKILLQTLFDVVQALRKDLNPDGAKDVLFSDGIKEKTVENFNDAYNTAKEGNDEEKEDKQHIMVDLNVLSDINTVLKAGNMEFVTTTKSNEHPNKVYDTTLWDAAVKKWGDKGWEVKALENEEYPLEITRGNDYPGRIDMGFYHDHYYIQAQYANDYIFSKCLKSEIGGFKTKDMWYEYPKASYNFSKGEFIDGFKSSTELQKEIISRVDYLLDVIEKNYRITQWKSAVGEPNGWSLYVWHWSTLACESQSGDNGTIYMDTMPNTDGGESTVIRIGNRANDVKLLKQTLSNLNVSTNIDNEKDCWTTLDTVDSTKPEDVSKKLKYWIGKLSENKS